MPTLVTLPTPLHDHRIWVESGSIPNINPTCSISILLLGAPRIRDADHQLGSGDPCQVKQAVELLRTSLGKFYHGTDTGM